MKTFVLLFALLMSSVFASAEVVSDFKRNAEVLPRALLSKGYSRIGSLELEAFLARVNRMNVREVGQVNHKQDLGSGIEMERNLAQWRRTATGDVAIGGANWKKTSMEARPLVALHESLGALGYSDDILSCSGALYILANDEARSALQEDGIARIEKIARGACIVAGGTTGVTGGGDGYIAHARIKSLRNGIAAIGSGKDRGQVIGDLESSLFMSFERKQNFKRKGSIFDPNYKHTKQCLDRSRGIADVRTIKVAYQGQPVPYSEKNGWTFDEATNCIYFHGSAVHGWAGMSVMWGRKQ